MVGTGFKPELELINPDKDEDINEKLIEQNQEIISTLIGIDNQLLRDEDRDLDVSFADKIAALITITNMFNRGALIFGYDKPIKVNGKIYKDIPSSLKFAHPRDLGIIQVNPATWRLQSVQWRNAYYMVPTKDMIYIWNPWVSAKTRNSYADWKDSAGFFVIKYFIRNQKQNIISSTTVFPKRLSFLFYYPT